MPFEKDVLTTGEVAKICNVAPRTVSKWFDSGSLKGYKIPGSKDRRIPVAQLIKPHVVLLHIHLAEGDSRAVAQMIRTEDELSMTKIIAMSGKMTDGQLA